MGQHISSYRIEGNKERERTGEAVWFIRGEILKEWCEESNSSGLRSKALGYYRRGRMLHCVRVGFPSKRDFSQRVTECLKFFPEATSFDYNEGGYVDIGFPTEGLAEAAMEKQLYLDGEIVPKTRPCTEGESLCMLILKGIPTTLKVTETERELHEGLKSYGRVLSYHVQKDSKFPDLTMGFAYAALAVKNTSRNIPKEAFLRVSPKEKFTVLCYNETPINQPPEYTRTDFSRSFTQRSDLCCWGE